MSEEFGRREFLAGGAAVGGAVAGLWALPHVVREAYGAPIQAPAGARSFEAGLSAFAAKWEAAGPAVRLTRFGPFLSDKIFNCRIAVASVRNRSSAWMFTCQVRPKRLKSFT